LTWRLLFNVIVLAAARLCAAPDSQITLETSTDLDGCALQTVVIRQSVRHTHSPDLHPTLPVIAVQEQRMGAAAAAAAADVTRCTTWVAPRQGIRQAHGRAPPCSYGGTPTSQEEEEEEDEGEEGWKLDAGKHNFLGARHNSHVQQQQQQPGQQPPGHQPPAGMYLVAV